MNVIGHITAFMLSVDTRRSYIVHKVRGEYVGRIVEHGGCVLGKRTENHRADCGADFPSH